MKNPTVYTSSIYFYIVGSVMLENGKFDLAYKYLENAFRSYSGDITYDKYYPLIYGQQFLSTDKSPLLITSGEILLDSYDDWVWLVEESSQRGDHQLSQSIWRWLRQSKGISSEGNSR
jgi:hypothetical protein